MNTVNRDDERQQVMFVDALGPVYANNQLRLLMTDDGLYYSKAGIYTLIKAAPGALLAHAASHQDGGSDEILVTGLAGLLADVQKVGIRKNSAGTVFTRQQLNFIEGANVTLTVADDAGTPEVDITIAASGGGASATLVGQVQISLDGSTFAAKLPVTDPLVGWLVDGTSGLMMVS